jgi:hypothetical protein
LTVEGLGSQPSAPRRRFSIPASIDVYPSSPRMKLAPLKA